MCLYMTVLVLKNIYRPQDLQRGLLTVSLSLFTHCLLTGLLTVISLWQNFESNNLQATGGVQIAILRSASTAGPISHGQGSWGLNGPLQRRTMVTSSSEGDHGVPLIIWLVFSCMMIFPQELSSSTFYIFLLFFMCFFFPFS